MAECPIRKPSMVPYVASWSGEVAGFEDELVVQLGRGEPRLGYRNECPEDRAGSGDVLWGRIEEARGVGRPQFDSMHPGRQYIAMYAMKCQVCGGPASKNKDGWLFLDWRKPQDPPTWPERSLTAMPPLCDAHVRLSMEECPHLRSTEVLVLRVWTPRLWGVSGTPYTLTADGWRTHEHDSLLPFGDPNLRGLLASRLYRELRNVTVVGGGLAD
ncbi:hypothetical protein [Streptomyces sp. NPDC017993]|uniref:hypothetical protein n=1 Tax=Streptomyces sp. NPDC017993 TaxID=3365027 RepID=UPI0037ACC2C8